MPPEITDDTLEAMERFGGSFVVALMRLYRTADPKNRAILARAFATYFTTYSAPVWRARNEPGAE